MTLKKWDIADFSDFENVSAKYSFASLAAKIAASRGYSPDFFSEDFFEFESPFELCDMDKAVDRINEAVENGEKITVYGDYDADGVCATVILCSYLEAIGADVDFYIPERETEGYGLNYDAVEKLKKQGTQLIVTVDNGISSVDEIDFCKSVRIDVVVTDHHKPQNALPDCIAVDPHRADCKSKFKDICGAAVALKLVAALDGGEYDGAIEQFAELVAIATVADVVPLVGENRSFVKLGLKAINNSENVGLKSLMESSGVSEMDSGTMSYTVVPRINAAGRMGSAARAVNLLLCEDKDAADKLCAEICADNDKRKQIETEIYSQIDEYFEKNPQKLYDRVITACGENWHHGVLGIVASRIVEKTGKPAIVFSRDGDFLVGSGRSVEGFSLFDALSANADMYEKFGGHSLAAGVTISADKFDEFSLKINEYAKKNHRFMPQNSVLIDAEISPLEITLPAVKELSCFEPFGKQNQQPVFAIRNLTLEKVSSMGNGKHSRLYFSNGNVNFSAVMFSVAPENVPVAVGRKTDIAVKLKENLYNDTVSVTVQIIDMRPSGINDELFFKEKQLFEQLALKEELTVKQANYLLPEREEFAAVYKYLSLFGEYNKNEDILASELDFKINRARISVILAVFSQCGIIKKSRETIKCVKTENKIDLSQTEIMQLISKMACL